MSSTPMLEKRNRKDMSFVLLHTRCYGFFFGCLPLHHMRPVPSSSQVIIVCTTQFSLCAHTNGSKTPNKYTARRKRATARERTKKVASFTWLHGDDWLFSLFSQFITHIYECNIVYCYSYYVFFTCVTIFLWSFSLSYTLSLCVCFVRTV